MALIVFGSQSSILQFQTHLSNYSERLQTLGEIMSFGFGKGDGTRF